MNFVTTTRYNFVNSEVEKYQGWKGDVLNTQVFDNRGDASRAYNQEVRKLAGVLDITTTHRGRENFGFVEKRKTKIQVNPEEFYLVSLVYNWDLYNIDLAKRLKPGTQILYVPEHADGHPDHQDVQPGFITEIRPEHGFAFCRYFYPDDEEEFGSSAGTLRTTGNSEGAKLQYIMIKKHRPQAEIRKCINDIKRRKKRLLEEGGL